MGRKKYTILRTPYGYLGAVYTAKGVAGVVFPEASAKSVKDEVIGNFGDAVRDDVKGSRYRDHLKKYFAGRPSRTSVKLDMEGVSDFDRSVYEAVRTVPFGQTHTYRWIAEKVGGSSKCRAVGQALSRNRYMILVPCHRIVGKEGLGGFSGGMKLKIDLLRLEGRVL